MRRACCSVLGTGEIYGHRPECGRYFGKESTAANIGIWPIMKFDASEYNTSCSYS